jgi:carbon monoxide dehydrogenase subunit G
MTTKVQKSITVDVPVRTAYNQWTQFEDFPQFMGGISKVEQLDDKRLHWVAEISGVKREWYATILEQRPDEKIAWAATEGATNAGAVYFTADGPSSTSVTLELEYEPEGLVETVGDRLNIVEKQTESDLDKFKSFIESLGAESGGWRGEVEGQTVGSPGVESAVASQGDSGKAGVSGKVAAVGVAAAAAGIAAVAAARSGSSQDTDTVDEGATDVEYVEVVETPVVEETTFTAASVNESSAAADDTYGTAAGLGHEVSPGGVELDSTTPGTTDYNDGSDQHGTL